MYLTVGCDFPNFFFFLGTRRFLPCYFYLLNTDYRYFYNMLLLYEIIYVIIIISLNFCLLWPYLRKFNYAHSPPIHNMCSFMSIYMFCIKYEALSYFPRNLCFYTPPSPGLTDTMLGGLGYVGGWCRAPMARQARGPSAAAI